MYTRYLDLSMHYLDVTKGSWINTGKRTQSDSVYNHTSDLQNLRSSCFVNHEYMHDYRLTLNDTKSTY